MNDTILFAYLRRAPFGGKLTQSQIDGVKRLLEGCERNGVLDERHQANVLAQVFHETGGRMQPVRETFATTDAQAIARLDKAKASGKLPQVKTLYWKGGWFGRGDIQITHRHNYAMMAALTGHPIDSNPSLALDPAISADIAIIGMKLGKFTGKKLSDFFNDKKDDPVNARRIVNGTDKAHLIAGYHQNFLAAIQAAQADDEPRADVTEEMAKPDDIPAPQSKSLWGVVLTFLTGTTGLGFLGNINNGFALGAFALVLVAGGIGAWLIGTGRVTFNRVPS